MIASMPSNSNARQRDMPIGLEKAIFERRAVREYTDESIDEATIRPLIRAAVQAPSAVNEQPWSFTVIRSRNMLDRISSSAKSHMLATMTPRPANNKLKVTIRKFRLLIHQKFYPPRRGRPRR